MVIPESQIAAAIAATIRDCRKRKLWSQHMLARKLNIEDQRISAYETGRIVPSATTLVLLADALGFDCRDVLHLCPMFADEMKEAVA